MNDDDFREMDRMENELEEDEWLSRDSKTHCGTGMPGSGSDEPQGRFMKVVYWVLLVIAFVVVTYIFFKMNT